jgi:hypothetical protein
LAAAVLVVHIPAAAVVEQFSKVGSLLQQQ